MEAIQDSALAEGVAYGIALNQINLPPEDARQFFLHGDEVEKRPGGVGRKRNEQIYVAVRAKIAPQRRVVV